MSNIDQNLRQIWGLDGHFEAVNWSLFVNSYDTKCKDFHFVCFLRFCKKTIICVVFFVIFVFFKVMCVFHFCLDFWANWGLDPFSTSKGLSESQFCEIYKGNCRKNCSRRDLCQSQILMISLYINENVC